MAFAAAGDVRANEPMTLAESFGRALPPAGGAATRGTLYLELVVNELSTGRIVPIRYRDGVYYARAGDLAQASVRTHAEPDALVDLSTLDGVQVEYESGEQRLKLSVPPDWLPQQAVGSRRLYDRTPAAVSFGLLFNYDVYANSPTLGTSYTSAWTEARLFDKWGTVTNTGVYRRDYGGSGGVASNRYLRYDTSWRYSDQDRMLTYTAGDVITGALSWSSAVRLGGVSIERDFKVRPDIVTYPLPQFSGQAAVPTAVDLFINGSKTTTGQVNPGPFTLNNVPFINGAGEATVVTTDALGRRVATTIPFYVANTLLQKGLSDYSLSVGAMRRDYGIRSFSYGKFAASGTARYGFTDYLTIEGHAEGGERLALGGLGFDVGVGMFGVLNVAATQSRLAGASGRQYAFGYSYSSQRFSVALQRIQRTDGFRDLSVYDLPSDVAYRLVRSSTQATGALNLGAIGGTLGAGYFDVRGADGARTRIANLSYTRPILRRATLYASVNKTIGDHGFAAQLQLIVPLGDKGVVTGSLARDQNNSVSERVQYSRSVPSDGGFGWNLAYAGGRFALSAGGRDVAQPLLPGAGRRVRLRRGARLCALGRDAGLGRRDGRRDAARESRRRRIRADRHARPQGRARALREPARRQDGRRRPPARAVGAVVLRGQVRNRSARAAEQCARAGRRAARGRARPRRRARHVPDREDRLRANLARRRRGPADRHRLARAARGERPDRARRLAGRDLFRRLVRGQSSARDDAGRPHVPSDVRCRRRRG